MMLSRTALISMALASLCDGISLRRDAIHRQAAVRSKIPSWINDDFEITSANLNFDNASIVHNNLGGAGPDGGLELIVYENVGSYFGEKLDLVFKAVGPYTASNTGNNILDTEGKFAQINIACDSSLDITAYIVRSGTWSSGPLEDNEIVLPIFFSVLDFDANSMHPARGVESVTISPVADIKVGSLVHVVNLSKTEFVLTATVEGDGDDNPTDAYDLTDLQRNKSAMVAIRNVSRFNVTFAAADCANGRNIVFSGASDVVSEPPSSCDTQETPQLDLSTLAVNNLDGSLPGPAIMRFDNIMTYEGKQVNLQVEPISGNYQAYDPTQNALNGEFAQINVGADLEVVFRFKLMSEGAPVWVDNFFFAYWDIDGTEGGHFETLSMLGQSGTYFLTNQTTLTVSSDTNAIAFTATEYGNLTDNPSTTEEDLTDDQKNKAVEFHFFQPVHNWDVKFSTAGFGVGRNFLFSGSMFACT